MINCAGCGANMRFDPELQLLKCDYCGTTADPKNLNADIVSPESRVRLGNNSIYDAKVYTCPQCGAELISDDDTAATFCSYCGASVIFDERTITMKAPSYVIPFMKTKKQCEDLYIKYVKGSIFAPKSLRNTERVERFRGIYMPYWVYDMGMEDAVHTNGQKSHRSGDYIITDNYSLVTEVRSHSNGVSFDASAAFADELSQAIAPFDFKQAQGFSAGYLSGYYVDTADVEAKVYDAEAREAVAATIATKMTADRTYANYSAKPSLDIIANKLQVQKADMAYFPVWFLSSNNKGYVSYAVVNGQTGKVCADIPIDYKKYILGSIIIALPIMILLDLIFTFRPIGLALITAAFAFVVYMIANNAMNRLYTRTHYLDDRGLRSSRNEAMPEAMQAKKTNKVKKTQNVFSNVGAVLNFLGFFIIGTGVEVTNVLVILLGFVLLMCGFIFAGIGNSTIKGAAPGLKYSRKKLVFKQPFKEKVPVLIKPLIAMALCFILMIVNPFIDLVYYLCVIGIMILVLTCVWDIVSIHNKLTKRMPRQFGRRGGDENESNF